MGAPREDSLTMILSLPVRQIMRRDFVSVSPEERLSDALAMMRLARLRHLLVEEDGRLVGILSYRDLLEARLPRSDGQLATQKPGDPVSSAMHPKPYVVTPDTTLRDAATRLCGLRLGCLPVVDRKIARPSLLGIVTEADLLIAAYQSH